MSKTSKKILLVEDESIIALDEAQMLQKRGYQTITAGSGEQAIKIIRSSPVDLILMDIDLGAGNMDGTETASRILKEHELPIVFLSSHTEPKIVEKTERITSYGYVVKNSGEHVLDASIKMAFKLFKAHQKVKKHREESEEAVRQISLREERLEHINRVLLSMRNINQIVTKDPDKAELLDETCRFLVDQSGYYYAWIVLLENGVPKETFFHHGDKKGRFSRIPKNLNAGKIPLCAEKAIRLKNIIITENPEKKCIECPFDESQSNLEDSPENACMTASIKHADHVYGWLSVSMPIVYASDRDEHELFREIVDDIGYALHKNEIENEKLEVFAKLSREKQERESILDGLVEHVIYEDTNLKIIWPNKAACDSVGMSREDLIGRHCYEIWPQRDAPCEDCPVMEAIQHGKYCEIEKSTPDGKWWFIRGNPVKDDRGRIMGAVEVTLDITERRRIEKRLHRSQENLKATLNSIGDAVIATDTDGRIERMNPVAENLTGWKQEDALGKPLPDVFHIIHAHTEEIADNPVDMVLKSGQIVGLANHTVLVSKNGTRYQIADSGAPIRDSEGNIIGVVLVFRDVTEDYHIREELRQNEDRLSKILLASNEGTWDWNLKTNEVHFDRRYYEMAGYKQNDFPHRLEEFQNRIHPDDVEYVMHTADKHLRGKIERFIVEFRFAKKGGGWIWILGRGIIVERDDNGAPLRFVGTHTDISKRKQIEEKLRTERRRLAYVLEGTNVGSWEWNVQTGETIFNERWAEIIGYTLKELSPTNLQTWTRFVHPEDLERSNMLLEKHFRGETDYYECEVRMKHKDGHWVWVLDRGKVASWTDDGKPLLISGTHQDITQRKQASVALHKSLREKENLLNELQHRVKNSFSLIISMMNLTSETVKSREALETLRMISSRIQAISELYSMLYQTESIHNIQMKTYCSKVISTLKHLSREIQMNSDVEDFSAPVREAASLGLILTELVTNAIKHAFSESEQGRIDVRLKKKGNCIQLEVENDGRPLPEGFDLHHLKGIGLQLVQALTSQHNGSFRFSRGKTTTIRVELQMD